MNQSLDNLRERAPTGPRRPYERPEVLSSAPFEVLALAQGSFAPGPPIKGG
jgi:hypothetical protein